MIADDIKYQLFKKTKLVSWIEEKLGHLGRHANLLDDSTMFEKTEDCHISTRQHKFNILVTCGSN